MATEHQRIGRRAFLKDGALVLAAATGVAPATGRAADGTLRFGLVTDLHYADKPPAGSRHYRESLAKFAESAGRFAKEKPAFVAELGDLVDAAESVDAELRYLKRIDREFAAAAADRHYVLGNHCVDTLRKEEFLDTVGRKESYYSFDRGGFHFIVLDACFRNDGVPYGRKNFRWTDTAIPAAERDWLKADLKGTDRPVIVLAHQRLDVADNHGVKNAPEVRKALEASGRVRAVFQGHSHKNDYKEIAGVHYCTLVAMVEGSGAESSGYSLVEARADGTLVVNGFRRQKGYEWKGGRG